MYMYFEMASTGLRGRLLVRVFLAVPAVIAMAIFVYLFVSWWWYARGVKHKLKLNLPWLYQKSN